MLKGGISLALKWYEICLFPLVCLNIGRRVMTNVEKRRYKRLVAKYNIACKKAGSEDRLSIVGRTVNVSPAGIFFETNTNDFKLGSLLEVQLSIPPSSTHLERSGRVSGLAKVVRTSRTSQLQAEPEPENTHRGVALQFCNSLKLSV